MIDRRSLMGFMAAAGWYGWKVRACAASGSDRGLFWRLEIPDQGTAIIFGAWPIAASVVPEILGDADRFVEATRRLIFTAPSFQSHEDVKTKDLKRLVEIVSPRVANEVREIVESNPGWWGHFQLENIPAFVMPLLLIAEGQTRMPPAGPAVPLTDMIRSYAEQLGGQSRSF